MAEAILTLVLRKLGDDAVKKTLYLNGAGGKLDLICHELDWIRAFLKDAESKRISDERVKNWVSDVQEMAYRIEDVIDTFIATVDNFNQPSIFNVLSRVLKKSMKLFNVHNLTSEMDEIQTRLCEIKECIKRYGIKELGDSSSNVVLTRPVSDVVLPDEDDPEVIGFEKDKDNIVKLLLDPNTKKCSVVSIVGQGGLGKTTLARKAYNSNKVKEEFEFRLWLSISQQFKPIDILKRILEKFRPLQEDEKSSPLMEDPVSEQWAMEHFITELNVSLTHRRYLIIMDDVRTHDLWIQVEKALPDVNNGSRVLVTTRFSDIAVRADPTSDPYHLPFLSEGESQQLLLKKAFPYKDPKTYPHVLSDLSKKFAIKCGYLPLALVVVGGLLSKQPPTFHSWHKVFEELSSHDDEGKKCKEIIAASYEQLPIVLKPCFMYFASFPEGYEVEAKSLIRIWVAERFIPEIENKTTEETAEDYLEELVQRSMIEVSSRFHNGSIKHCRIHDLLLEYAIEKAKENRFLEIIPNQGGNCSSSTVFVRRSALHCDRMDIIDYTGPNLRSLSYSCGLPNADKFRLLEIFNGIDKKFDLIIGNFFEKLAQLRYLKVYGDLHVLCHERKFWKSVSHMRNLQTLEIPKLITKHNDDASDYIWDIMTLRHVILPGNYYGPPSTAYLPNLQTLKTVRVRKSWVAKGWPKMSNIQVLKLREFPFNYGQSFRIFLRGLNHLTSLHTYVVDGIEDDPMNYEMMDMSVFPCYNHLQSMYVIGKWTGVVDFASSFPKHLTKLKLVHARIEEDPMPVLEKLENLKVLVLGNDAYKGRHLCCSVRGFPRLQFLTLDDLKQLEEWKTAEGAMPMLKEITINWCLQLRLIPELHHMPSLCKLTVHLVDSNLSSLLEDESEKIREGQYIHFDIL